MASIDGIEEEPVAIDDAENTDSSIDQEKKEMSEEEIKDMLKEFYHNIGNKLSTAVTFSYLVVSGPVDEEVMDLGKFGAEDLKTAYEYAENFKSFIEEHKEFRKYLTSEDLGEIQDLIGKTIVSVENGDFVSADQSFKENAVKNVNNMYEKYKSTLATGKKEKVVAKDLQSSERTLEDALTLPDESVN